MPTDCFSLRVLSELMPQYHGITHGERLVAYALAAHLNQQSQTAWPSAETLGKEIDMHMRTVQEHLRALVKKGILKVAAKRHVHRGYVNEYRFLKPAPLVGDSTHHSKRVAGDSRPTGGRFRCSLVGPTALPTSDLTRKEPEKPPADLLADELARDTAEHPNDPF